MYMKGTIGNQRGTSCREDRIKDPFGGTRACRTKVTYHNMYIPGFHTLQIHHGRFRMNQVSRLFTFPDRQAETDPSHFKTKGTGARMS
jgi:hypothetical protein